MNNKFKKILSSTLAITLATATMFTTGIVVNATELSNVEKTTDAEGNTIVTQTENPTEYTTVADKVEEALPEVSAEPVLNMNSIEEIDSKDTINETSDSIFKSCRLIVTSPTDLEFKEESLGVDNIVSVQKYEDKYFVTYRSVFATEKAYNDLTALGLDVEIDTVQDIPEGVEIKDDRGNNIKAKDIALTEETRPTESVEDVVVEDTQKNEKTIVVAVLDTGLNNEEEIFDNKVIEGKNFVSEAEDIKDLDGHGTTMSRIVLDTTEDNVKILPIKVLNDEGKGTTLSAYKGIKYVIEEKKENPNLDFVVNLSMSGIGHSKLLESTINEAYNNNIPVVVAAGNDNTEITNYTPANVDSAFTIGSADKNVINEEEIEYSKANYSNFGSDTNNIDYVTNGHYEYVRYTNDKEVITKIDGTSVSSAYVAGYVSMLKQMALSDDNSDNDNLSIADINTSLSESAVKLEDITLGRGYLEKENIQLKKVEEEVEEELPVADVTDENIELTKDGGNVLWREFYVRGFPSSLSWAIRMYAVNDYNAYDQRYGYWITKNGYTEFGLPDGGVIKVSTNDTEARIEYNFCNIENWTPWVEVSYNVNNPTWRYEYTDRTYHPDNTWQDDAPEVHYKPDEVNPGYIDCYAGIGFKYADYQVHFIPRDFYVTYDCNGGSFADGQISYNRVAYSGVWGTNGFGLGVGCDAPIRTGYIFKGWFIGDYADDNIWVGKNTVTNLIDYSNRYADVKRAFGYRMSALNNHFWSYGLGEGRTIAEHCTCPLDVLNGYNFDNYNQLLPASQFLSDMWQGDGAFQFNVAGKNLKAVAIWEPVKYTVNYNYNNGYGEKATQSCQFDSAYTVQAAPSKYKSANLVFDSNGGSAVGNVKTTKTFLGWDSDNDVGIFGTYVDYSRTTSSAYDTTYNAARYANVNPDLYNAFGGYTGTSLVSHWAANAKKEGRVCTGSGNINDASNYYQPNRTFKNLTVSNRTVNMTGRWKNNSAKLPSAPTRPEYDFLGWQAPDGKIYQPNDTYTPANDNDVTFTAVWRRNTAKVTYNPNGAVDKDGKAYVPFEEDEQTRLREDYTPKDGSIFGEKQTKDGYFERQQQVNDFVTNHIYYITKEGEVVNTKGSDTDMYSFQGWSVLDYAQKSKAEQIIYDGITTFYNLYFDENGAMQLNYLTQPRGMQLATIVTNIVNHRNNNIGALNNGQLGSLNAFLEATGIVNVYAVWDKYPTIETRTFTISSRDAENLTDELLLDKIKVTDEEDGTISKDKIKLIYDKDQIVGLAEQGTCYTSITVVAEDSVGNVTKKVIMIGVNQVNPLSRNEQGFIRFISREAFDKSEADGGPLENSIWRTDEEYRKTMLENFDNLENNTPEQRWNFTHEQVLEVQDYIKTNGFGKTKSDDSLKNFYDKFESEGCLTENKLAI